MAKGFKAGSGGGAPLNFKVVGGTKPSNPKENTIWVNTDTAITDWVFSATQPAAVSGRVWIKTGTTSTVEMNVLKKNSIQVCPLNAKQCVGGAWALKDAETYQSGKWNDWAYWIIGNGADGSGITGGFTSEYANQWEFRSDGSLKLYRDGGNAYSSAHVPSKRTFDVTNYNRMTIKVSSFSRKASYIGLNAPSNLGNDSTCKVKISAAGTYTLDVSGVSGAMHIQADLDYNGVDMVVSELYFS